MIFIASGTLTVAQSFPEVYVRELAIEKVAYRQGDVVRGTAVVSNDSPSSVSGLQYIVRIVGDFRDDGIPQTEYAAKVSDTFSLNSSEKKQIDFDIPLPPGVAGDLGIDVQAVLTSGVPLGWATERVPVSGTSALLQVVDVAVVISDDPYHPAAGPTVRPDSTATLRIELANTHAETVVLTPTLTLYKRTELSDPLSTELLSPFTVASGDPMVRDFSLPTDLEPGVYAGVLALGDASGVARVPDISFRYIVWGESASITNIQSDKGMGSAGDIVVLTVSFAGAPFDIATGETPDTGPAQLRALLVDENGEPAGEAAISIDLTNATADLPVPLAKSADALHAVVSIERNGAILAQMSVQLAGSADHTTTPLLGAALAVAVLLAIVGLIALHRFLRHLPAPPATLAVLALTFSGLLAPSATEAFTATQSGWQPSGLVECSITWCSGDYGPAWPPSWLLRVPPADEPGLWVNTPSGELEPGEAFYVEGMFYSHVCYNAPQGVYVSATFRGTEKHFYRATWYGGAESKGTLNDRFSIGPFYAPTKPGTYYVDIGAAHFTGPYKRGDVGLYDVGGVYGYQEFTVACASSQTWNGSRCVDIPPPAAPVISSLSSGAACTVGEPHTISFSATDPDGNNVRFGIDWNEDGKIDEWVPSSGYVPSGTRRSATHTYQSSGQQTVQIKAQDDGGLTSGWAKLSFHCAVPWIEEDDDGREQEQSTQCVPSYICHGNDLYLRSGAQCTETFVQTCSYACASGLCLVDLPQLPSGSIHAVPALVRRNATTQVIWSASHVSSCEVTEDNPEIADAWTGTSGEESSSPIPQRTVYTLSCTGTDGSPLTESATVNLLPIYEEL